MRKKLIISLLALMTVVFGYNTCFAANETAEEEAGLTKQIQASKNVTPDRQGPPPAEFGAPHKGRHHMAPPPSEEEMAAKKAEIDKRLKLTDKQKKQIEANKTKDIEKIKPVLDEISTKKQELKKLKDDTALSQTDKAKQEEQLRKEIKDLHSKVKAAHEENMKNFESVLTKKQKKEFTKIKEEQKKEMEKRQKKFDKQNKEGKGMQRPPHHPDEFGQNPPPFPPQEAKTEASQSQTTTQTKTGK